MDIRSLTIRVRLVLILFMAGLVVSGLTAFPLAWELRGLHGMLGDPGDHAWVSPGLAYWIAFVNQGLRESYRAYPFLAYGTDWLAFAHIVIAIAFIGPLRDPVKNIWVVEFGMIACVLVIPLALIMGPLRGIPFYWRLIDCSFGVVGIIPLWYCRRLISRMARQEQPAGLAAR